MACDYTADFEAIINKPNRPGFIHYAGNGRDLDAPIARLIFDYLTAEESAEMTADFNKRKDQARKERHWPMWIRIAKRIIPLIDRRFQIQWNESKKAV